MSHIFPILEALLLPPGLILLLLAAALLLVRLGRRRTGFALGIVSLVLGYLVSIRPIADLMISPLENRFAPYSAAHTRGAQYVVVLGGGIIPVSPAEGGGGALAPEALKRLVYGIRIARAAGLPMIVSGGIVPALRAKESEAAVAKRTVEELSGSKPEVLTEGRSRNTWGNAVDVAAKYHPKKVILVTSAYHMPRSVLAFERNHMQVVPAPTDYLSDRGGYTLYSYLPGAGALKESQAALKEYLGNLYYRLFLFTTKRSS